MAAGHIVDAMFAILVALLRTLRSAVRTHTDLAPENLALRQQLAALHHSAPRPRLRTVDRLFWVALSKMWSHWSAALVIIKPDTIIGWHHAGFRLFWR
jgi:putative transposase